MVSLYAIALLCIGDNTLLVRRVGASFGDGLYGLVGGKVEAGETALHAIQREVQEETLLDIPKDKFELVHTFHRKGTESELIALVFKADITGMNPVNNEPEKHDAMQLFAFDELPQNTIPAHKQAIELIQKGITYSEHGW